MFEILSWRWEERTQSMVNHTIPLRTIHLSKENIIDTISLQRFICLNCNIYQNEDFVLIIPSVESFILFCYKNLRYNWTYRWDSFSLLFFLVWVTFTYSTIERKNNWCRMVSNKTRCFLYIKTKWKYWRLGYDRSNTCSINISICIQYSCNLSQYKKYFM